MKYLIVGGAGFIGSHVVRRLLAEAKTTAVRVFDNFSSGSRTFLPAPESESRLGIVEGDAADLPALVSAATGCEVIFHFASNPDIARAVKEPTIDFHSGTLLTQNVAEAARLAGCRTVIYASGSGVYGEMGNSWYAEDQLSGRVSSTYGASKLAGETLLCSYCAMFDLRAYAFRFANVVGPRQTHGVGFDFLRRLKLNPTELSILGDGQQTKSYVHVDDVITAMLLLRDRDPGSFDVFNVATDDFLTVTEIAHLALEVLGVPAGGVKFSYSGGSRGWKGDVPVVRLNTTKLKSLGWKAQRTTRQAMHAALEAMARPS